MRSVKFEKKGNRIIRYDYARVICMIWIVGIFHMMNYMNISIEWFNDITLCVLATFFFISGRLSTKYQVYSFYDGLNYIKHKLIAIFPLYLLSIALIVFTSVGNISGIQRQMKMFFFFFTCINAFYPPMIMTMWFLTVLILFYLITPIFLSDIKMKWKICIALILYFILLTEYIFVKTADDRIVTYFPFYILGLLMNSDLEKKLLRIGYIVISVILLCIITYFSGIIELPRSVALHIQLVLKLSFMFSLLGICEIAAKYGNKIYRIVGFIASASTFAYLFHRQYYAIWEAFFNPFPYWLAYLVIFPTLIVLSYFGQKLYNRIVRQFKSVRKKPS